MDEVSASLLEFFLDLMAWASEDGASGGGKHVTGGLVRPLSKTPRGAQMMVLRWGRPLSPGKFSQPFGRILGLVDTGREFVGTTPACGFFTPELL